MERAAFSQQLEKVVLTLCEDAATPRALTVSLLLRAREYEQLLQLKIDPHHYLDAPATAEKLFWDTQVTDLVRKLEINLGRDLSSECWEAFLDDERTNARTNVRFRRLLDGCINPSEMPQVTLLAEIQRQVRRILGPAPKALDLARFGKGGTFDDVGHHTTIPDKMSSRPTVYKSAECLLNIWHENAWSRALVDAYAWKSRPKTVRGNRFGTVKKTALVRRGIASEASISGYYQLAVGTEMRHRLRRRVRIDLDRAQPWHRDLARVSSMSRSHASVDLSSASNLNARLMVRAALALCPEWLDLLETLRAPLVRAPHGVPQKGKWYYLEMFSSMGNGFTFELETVIFLACCLAVAKLEGHDYEPGVDIFVYGDDILVPTEIAPTVISALQWLGHKPNQRKTFLTGHFRESCGGDYFCGTPVRAHFQKIDPTCPSHWIAFANGLRRVARDPRACPSRWHKMRRTWRRCLDQLPNDIRKLRGPPSLGDSVIHDDTGWVLRESSPWIYEILGLVPMPLVLGWEHWHADVVFAASLYGCQSSGVTPRANGEDVIIGHRKAWMACIEARPGITGHVQ